MERSSRPPNAPPTPESFQPDLIRVQPEALCYLVLVYVQPLGRDVQVNPTEPIRHREPGLRPQKSLVLHPDLVLPRDDYIRRRLRLPVHDADAP